MKAEIALPHKGQRIPYPDKIRHQRGFLMRKFSLTHDQIEIVAHLSEGKTNSEIANEICRCRKTVFWHFTQINRKLKTKNRTQVILKVIEALYHG